MIVYILRHAEAFPSGTEGITCDEERFLTPKGEKQAQRAGKALLKIEAKPKKVLSSPLVRARQTAELAVTQMGDIPIEIYQPLACPADLEVVVDKLHEFAGEDEVLLVGHQPDLGQLTGWLAFGDPNLEIDLKKAGIATIEIVSWVDRPPGRLLWVMPPGLLRLVAG